MAAVEDKAKAKSLVWVLINQMLLVAFVITASYLFGCQLDSFFGIPAASTYLTPVQNIGEISIKRAGEHFLLFTNDGPKKGRLILRESLTRDTEKALDGFFSGSGHLTSKHVSEIIDLSRPTGRRE